MENILILDTETTGFSVKSNQIIEIAAILFNIETKTIIHEASTLLYSNSNAAYRHNNISVEALQSVNLDLSIKIQETIAKMMVQADAVVCHNKEFDKKFVETLPILESISMHKQWICTVKDVKWPIPNGKKVKLSSLCLELGVPIIEKQYMDHISILILSNHRALQDCKLLTALLCKMGDIEKFLLYSKKLHDHKFHMSGRVSD